LKRARSHPSAFRISTSDLRQPRSDIESHG
jgi:hypothetical protein